MQEKNLGGTKLRDEFGYDIPEEEMSEYLTFSPPNGVSRSPMVASRNRPSYFVWEHRELFGNRPEPVFPSWPRFSMPTTAQCPSSPRRCLWTRAWGRTRKNRMLVHHRSRRRFRDYLWSQCKSKKNSASKLRIKLGCLADKVPVKAGDFFYVPSGTMRYWCGILILETQQSEAIPPIVSMTLTVRMTMVTCVNFTLKNPSMFWTLVSLLITVL